MTTDRRDAVADLPPSAKLVFVVLERTDRLTQAGLADETLLPRRTVRYALDELRDADVLREELNVRDARQRFYSLADPGGGDDGSAVGSGDDPTVSAE